MLFEKTNYEDGGQAMTEFLGDALKLLMAGLLGLLWFDIRKIRGERTQQLETMDHKLDGYISAEKHKDMCKINTLKQNAALMAEFDKKLTERLNERFDDFKEFIRLNGFK